MSEAIVVVDREQDLMLSPVMDIQTARARLKTFQEFVQGYLVEGINGDFGTIPGTPKPTLLKPGADKLCELYGLADDYMVVPEYSREDWNRQPPLFDFTVRCILTSKRTGGHVSTGLGNCNSQEARYKWRDQKQSCPECHKETIFKDKKDGGFYCWTKKGGCGKTFSADEVRIIGQVSGRVENDDVATLKNTILKMAKKRAKIDATLSATRSSGIFTQDMEDIVDVEVTHTPTTPQPTQSHAPAQGATPTPKPQPTTAAPASDWLHAGEEFGMIEKLSPIKMGGADKKKPFRVFTFNGKSVFCWDKNLHQFLGENADQNIYAVLETKNNFTSLIACRASDTQDHSGDTFSDGEPLPTEPF